MGARAGGLAALAGVVAFLAVVIPLHLLQPGYDPKQQLMSELALGPHGGAMLVAFAGLALSAFGIQAAIGALGSGWPLRGLLLAASACFLASGVFPLGATAEIHIGAIACAFVLSVLAMYLFPRSAGRASAWVPRIASWGCAAGVAASVALGHSMLPMGIGQRGAAAFLLLWMALVGWQVSRPMRQSAAKTS